MINQNLLSKDIEFIRFYATEEEKMLKNIYKKFIESCDCYKSDNTRNFISTIDDFGNNISKIYDKRLQYIEILNAVISLYNTTSAENANMFKKLADSNINK